jgi:hypothetical protein
MTPLLLWIVRVLILILIVRLVIKGVTAMMRSNSGERRARMPARSGGTLVRDPQCGTFVPESRAIAAGRGADALHFCSTACRDAWMAAHGGARAKV